MESPLSPSHVVIVYDAMKDRSEHELNLVVDSVRARGDILRAGDTLVVLGIMQRVQHPMGYQAKAYPDAFGLSNRAMEEEVSKKVDSYVNMLLRSAEKCEDQGVSIEVKITAGFPIKHVTIQEVITCKANWVVLDRYLRRDLTFYLKQIPCKVALIQDGLSVDILRRHTTRVTDAVEHKLFYSMSKPVPLFNYQSTPHVEQSSFFFGSYSLSMGSLESSETHKSNMMPSYFLKSHDPSTSLDFGSFSKQEKSGAKGQYKSSNGSQTIEDSAKYTLGQRSLDVPLLCVGCGTKTELYVKDAMRFSFSDIQLATDDFSKENLIGEGGYGHVYKGQLKHGQLIAAKVRKEASEQGFAEFHSEVYVLSFARHKNIIMLLGHCCKENLNILVYEYICNKSLDWHLYDKAATALEWHQRYAVAIGTAKGLRFLHEECRGGPIIHRDMRPSNILLTHDFIPMLGDFGLAKWKTSDDPVQTRILGTLGYLAPEYAENGIVSVRTDVYAFGIILLQLISGRKAVDSKQNEKQQSLRQWAEPIIEKLALHELVDPRLGDAYDPYELYIIAKAAYMCVQRSPEMRPSMGEVVRLLEGESDHFRHLEQCVPRYSEVKASITRLNSDSDT